MCHGQFAALGFQVNPCFALLAVAAVKHRAEFVSRHFFGRKTFENFAVQFFQPFYPRRNIALITNPVEFLRQGYNRFALGNNGTFQRINSVFQGTL